jgi:aspartate aminotransferase
MVAEYRRRRDYVHGAVSAWPNVTCVNPQGAFYVFPNVARYLRAGMPTTLALSERLLEEKGVAVVPGEAFEAPGHLRISFARSLDELKDGMERISSFLSKLGQ